MFASNIQHHPAETMEHLIFLYISVPFGGALPQQLSVDLQPQFVFFPPKKTPEMGWLEDNQVFQDNQIEFTQEKTARCKYQVLIIPYQYSILLSRKKSTNISYIIISYTIPNNKPHYESQLSHIIPIISPYTHIYPILSPHIYPILSPHTIPYTLW